MVDAGDIRVVIGCGHRCDPTPGGVDGESRVIERRVGDPLLPARFDIDNMDLPSAIVDPAPAAEAVVE